MVLSSVRSCMLQYGPGQVPCAHWWNRVKMVVRVTSCFLIRKKAYSMEETPAWYCKLVRSPRLKRS